MKGITFFLDVSVHLYADNHELQSWHRRFLECCGRTSSVPGKVGFSDVKRDNAFYWCINPHNIRISRESAELWWLDDPDVSGPARNASKGAGLNEQTLRPRERVEGIDWNPNVSLWCREIMDGIDLTDGNRTIEKFSLYPRCHRERRSCCPG
jgi:hypothetical protein